MTSPVLAWIQAVARGDSPNGGPPTIEGDVWGDIAATINDAWQASGAQGVREAITGVIERRPELVSVLSQPGQDTPNGASTGSSRPDDTAVTATSTATEYPCPEILWQGFFAEVAKRLGKRSWEIWTGTFAALSAHANRNIRLPYFGSIIYGMSYTLLLKPTGTGKSECTETCGALLPVWYVVRESMQSGEALAQMFAATERDSKGKVISLAPRPAMIISEEFSTILKLAQINTSTITDGLNKIFHATKSVNFSRSDRPGAGGELIIPNPTLTILGTTTISLFKKYIMNYDLTENGFLNRFLILPGSKTTWKYWDEDRARMNYQSLSGLADNLPTAKWTDESALRVYSPEAAAKQRTWGELFLEPMMNQDGEASASYRRMHIYSHIIPAIYAWGEGKRTIEPSHVEASIAVIETWKRFVDSLMSMPGEVDAPLHEQRMNSLEKKVLLNIRSNPGIPQRALTRNLSGSTGPSSGMLTTAIKNLKEAKIIEAKPGEYGGKSSNDCLFIRND